MPTSLALSYQVIFHPNFHQPWQYFITSCWQGKVRFWPIDELINHPWQEKVRFWPTDELIHHPWQYLFRFFLKKCHPKSYHSDMKYHMILNIIFGVVHMVIWPNNQNKQEEIDVLEPNSSLASPIHLAVKLASPKLQSFAALGSQVGAWIFQMCTVKL